MLLGALVISTGAYSNYVESLSSTSHGETGFISAVRGSQLTVADIEEVALRMEALPRFAELEPAGAESIAIDKIDSFGLIAQGAPTRD